MSESKRQSDRNLRNAKAIAGLLQNQGYDEIIVALGKDDSMDTAIQGKNENTPYILYKLFNKALSELEENK